MPWQSDLQQTASINQYCKFDRKNYFYPDNPQNYQISQLYLPICRNGYVEIETAGGQKTGTVSMRSIWRRMPENWCTMSGRTVSLVDYNRSGVPLIEIVSEPDMRSCR